MTVENLSQKSHVVVVDDKTSGKQYSICTDCLHTDLAFDDQNPAPLVTRDTCSTLDAVVWIASPSGRDGKRVFLIAQILNDFN